MSARPISKISVIYNVALITVDNLPNNMKMISIIMSSIAKEKINVDMISQSKPYKGSINLSFSIPGDALVKAIGALNAYKKEVPDLNIEVDAGNTKLTVFGEKMNDIPGVAAKLYSIFAESWIEVKLVTTSEVDISFLINEKDVDRAKQAIKQEFKIE